MPKLPLTSEILSEARIKHVTQLLIQGLSAREIGKEIGLSTDRVHKLMQSEDLRAHLKDVADSQVSAAANAWKSAMQDRIGRALLVLDNRLAANDLEAVKLIIKSVGIEKQEAPQQGGNLTVVLPDYRQEKVIDASTAVSKE